MTTSDIPPLKALGAKAEARYDNPDPAMLEAFANPHPGKPWIVELDCGEFTSLCPVTGQPDFGTIHIHYVPERLCVESKSLKLYLASYRNHGSFHEDCINRIADHLSDRLTPRYLRIFGDFAPRGGIAIRPLALRVALDLGEHERAVISELFAHHDALRPRRRHWG